MLKRTLKRKLMLGVAVAAVLAGGTAAVVMAAQPAAGHSHRHGALATATSYLGLSTPQLRDELRAGKSLAQIADATGGKSEAGLIAALEAARKQKLAAAAAGISARVTAEVEAVGGPRTHRGLERWHRQLLGSSASYLGLANSKLAAELRSGRTLAQVAGETPGKSGAGLVEALVSARKTALAKAVAAGKIAQQRADTALPRLVSRVTAAVNRVYSGKRAGATAAPTG
jgi:hypothetical protein